MIQIILHIYKIPWKQNILLFSFLCLLVVMCYSIQQFLRHCQKSWLYLALQLSSQCSWIFTVKLSEIIFYTFLHFLVFFIPSFTVISLSSLLLHWNCFTKFKTTQLSQIQWLILSHSLLAFSSIWLFLVSFIL